jgi:hypothetical protein
VLIESKKDLRLISRALRENWNSPKKEIRNALTEIIKNRDPDLMLDAIDLFLKADALDLKREELLMKKEADANNERLRLLELAKSIPVADLARLASENGIVG